MSPPDDKPILHFAEIFEFREWLREHHDAHRGIWLRYFKKASGQPTLVPKEAVREALCWGWIDGQGQPGDEVSWLVKFTPRGSRSTWSQVNVGHVEELVREGRMMPAGLAAVEAAKADGRWAGAYASSSTFEMPGDFMAALAKKPKALAFFHSLAKSKHYTIYHRLHTAKRPETRARRLKDFLALLQKGEFPKLS